MSVDLTQMDLQKIVKLALLEDIPNGDVTTDNLHLENLKGRARLVAKEDIVLSGSDLFTLTFQELDPDIQAHWQFTDGSLVLKNQTICILTGRWATLLKGERVALNFLGHLSGVATITRCYVEQLSGTKTKILDTRKTTPGLRGLEKKAVRDGGGVNHRLNLSSAILIKENHIRAVGGIQKAVTLLRKTSKLPIQVEVTTLAEVREAIESKVNSLLLDNMSNEDTNAALKMLPAGIKTEASGNMTLPRIREVSALGVDFISVGALTHSAPCADLSLLFEEVPRT